jgi:chemotaxis signal transduction protein
VTAAGNSSSSFVLLQLGGRRFALPAEIVTELAPPVRLHGFPHNSAMLSGVIVRRARIIPVYDAGSVLIGRRSSTHRFYLIARREFGKVSELSAIPVDGECELVSGEVRPTRAGHAAYVKGQVSVGEDLIDILDLEALVTQGQAAPDSSNQPEAKS